MHRKRAALYDKGLRVDVNVDLQRKKASVCWPYVHPAAGRSRRRKSTLLYTLSLYFGCSCPKAWLAATSAVKCELTELSQVLAEQPQEVTVLVTPTEIVWYRRR
jgi:hypothetical protein